MTSRILKLFYQLRVHRFGAWALDRWAVTAVWGGAAFLLLRWLLRGTPAISWWHWFVLGLLIVAGGALLALARWAARRAYSIFEPQDDLPQPAACALDPEDKVLHRATGRFEVAGKPHFWAELLAYWRTFAIREHAVLAIIHPSRFLLLGSVSESDLGMWYIFFRPEDVRTITPGRLTFGATVRPALRVVYAIVPTASMGRKRPSQPIIDTVYLAFDDEAVRGKVWGDLLAQ
ncbi:MAG: hypothetical protein NT169_19100 [Chloroflexi bacterium]|nr:hypothetical protein [Chloroflexota bacterium]